MPPRATPEDSALVKVFVPACESRSRAMHSHEMSTMSSHLSKILTPVLGFALLAGSPGDVTAQLEHLPYQLKYDRGQTVQPVFDGWSRNADGTFDMHFGYLNRNYVEEVRVPIGPDNRIEPGRPDQGQPAFFHVRSNRRIFTVTVPSDFGDQNLIWSLTARGETLRAMGWLHSKWEILENSTGIRRNREEDEEPNRPPEVTFAGSLFSVTLPATLTVTAMVSDDGKPEPRPVDQDQADDPDPQPFVGTQSRPPLLNQPGDALEIPVNIPQHERPRQIRPRGVASVSYEVWRGPANITPEPYFAEVENGTATSRITFTEPGEYRLRVRANDGQLSTDEFVTVNVRE